MLWVLGEAALGVESARQRRQHLALGVTDKRPTPKVQSTLRVAFMADTIDCRDVHPVCDGVPPLNRAPRIVLQLAFRRDILG